MEADLKQKWIDALLSGNYKQSKEYLRTEKGYCCLGVLCDIMYPDHWSEHEEYDTEGDVEYTTWSHFDGDDELPNPEIIEEVGLDKEVWVDGEKHKLVRLLAKRNDEGLPFSKIAELIKEHV